MQKLKSSAHHLFPLVAEDLLHSRVTRDDGLGRQIHDKDSFLQACESSLKKYISEPQGFLSTLTFSDTSRKEDYSRDPARLVKDRRNLREKPQSLPPPLYLLFEVEALARGCDVLHPHEDTRSYGGIKEISRCLSYDILRF